MKWTGADATSLEPPAFKLYRLTDKRERAREDLTTATTMYRYIGMTYWLLRDRRRG